MGGWGGAGRASSARTTPRPTRRPHRPTRSGFRASVAVGGTRWKRWARAGAAAPPAPLHPPPSFADPHHGEGLEPNSGDVPWRATWLGEAGQKSGAAAPDLARIRWRKARSRTRAGATSTDRHGDSRGPERPVPRPARPARDLNILLPHVLHGMQAATLCSQGRSRPSLGRPPFGLRACLSDPLPDGRMWSCPSDIRNPHPHPLK